MAMALDLQSPVVFFVLCGLWALMMIALLISAARLSYKIEARSGRRPLSSGLPGYANVLPTAFNMGVARDSQTQAMRWRMNQRLIAILAGFGVFYLILTAAGAI